MGVDELNQHRARRLDDLLHSKFSGVKAELGRALGYTSGAFVRQMLEGKRPVTEKTVLRVHALPGCAGWFDAAAKEPTPSPRLSDMLNEVARSIAARPRLDRIQLAGLLPLLATEPDTRVETCAAIMRWIVPGEAQADAVTAPVAVSNAPPVRPLQGSVMIDDVDQTDNRTSSKRSTKSAQKAP